MREALSAVVVGLVVSLALGIPTAQAGGSQDKGCVNVTVSGDVEAKTSVCSGVLGNHSGNDSWWSGAEDPVEVNVTGEAEEALEPAEPWLDLLVQAVEAIVEGEGPDPDTGQPGPETLLGAVLDLVGDPSAPGTPGEPDPDTPLPGSPTGVGLCADSGWYGVVVETGARETFLCVSWDHGSSDGGTDVGTESCGPGSSGTIVEEEGSGARAGACATQEARIGTDPSGGPAIGIEDCELQGGQDPRASVGDTGVAVCLRLVFSPGSGGPGGVDTSPCPEGGQDPSVTAAGYRVQVCVRAGVFE